MSAPLYVALVHHPVYDKHRRIVTTSVTNIDVHDIARSCRTYGVEAFYVVTPVDALRGLVRKILKHWREGVGADYNPNRKQAIDLVRLQQSLSGVAIDIEQETGSLPVTVATSARPMNDSIGFERMRAELDRSDAPHLLLLGTGWGLTEQITEEAAYRLEPVLGAATQGAGDGSNAASDGSSGAGDGSNGAGDGYNHLSVRAAAAILLDRLLGTR